MTVAYCSNLMIILGLLAGQISANSQASEICVTSAVGLEFALAAAEQNGQSDVIKVAQGVYDAPLLGFSYFSSENFDLSISGGWTELSGDPCGQQPSGNAFNTILNGNNDTRVLLIAAGDTSNISVSHLFFANGFMPVGFHASGLLVTQNIDHSGQIIIENNAFINNQADNASALRVWNGEWLIVRNNLFTGNKNINGYTVDIFQTDAEGVYFTNNTVYQNSQDLFTNQYQGELGSGLKLHVNSTSRAFVANNLFWDNDINDLHMIGSGFKYLKNNDVGVQLGGADVSPNNISIEPMLEVGLFNYSPAAGSALINAGIEPLLVVPQPPAFDQNWDLGLYDLVGNDRVQMGGVDIGAVESNQLDVIFVEGFDLIILF